MTVRLPSWVQSANNAQTDFPLNNLPYGVFSTASLAPRCGVAIGDQILDCVQAQQAGVLGFDGLFNAPSWNAVMEAGAEIWDQVRARFMEVLAEGSEAQAKAAECLIAQSEAQLHMPFVGCGVHGFLLRQASRHQRWHHVARR